tara:strand:+ start:460 stop:702 length:243 start_codon:yes stop_codon:yes gene_type:complete
LKIILIKKIIEIIYSKYYSKYYSKMFYIIVLGTWIIIVIFAIILILLDIIQLLIVLIKDIKINNNPLIQIKKYLNNNYFD